MKTLFVTIHHRNLLLHDKGLDLLRGEGFDVFVLNNDHDNYDNGVVRLSELVSSMDWDILHFVDNDCFIFDTTYTKQTIEDFAKSDLGFASFFENGYGNDYMEYKFKGTIAKVDDQTFIEGYPFMSPSWENAMMMFKRSAWEAITDYSDMNKYLPELWRKGFKFGVKKVEPKLKYSHKGDGFFHIGNLMKYYYMLEKGEEIPIDEISKARLGYFQYDKLMPGTEYIKYFEELL